MSPCVCLCFENYSMNPVSTVPSNLLYSAAKGPPYTFVVIGATSTCANCLLRTKLMSPLETSTASRPLQRAVVAYNSLAALQGWLHSPQRRHRRKQERRCCLFTEHRRARMSCAAAAPASPLVVCKFSVRHCRLARASKEGATHSDFIAREAQSLVHLAGVTKISTGTVLIVYNCCRKA